MIVIISSISRTELRISKRAKGRDGITYNWSVLHEGTMISHGIDTRPDALSLARLAIEESAKHVNLVLRPMVLELLREIVAIPVDPRERPHGCVYASFLGRCESEEQHGIDAPHYVILGSGERLEWFA